MLSAICPIPSTLQVQAQPYLDLLKHTLTRHVNNAQQKTDGWSDAKTVTGTFLCEVSMSVSSAIAMVLVSVVVEVSIFISS